MKLLVVTVFLTAVVLSVKAMPAGQYPEQEREESVYVPHVQKHSLAKLASSSFHKLRLTRVKPDDASFAGEQLRYRVEPLHEDYHHPSPLLTHVVSSVAHGIAYLAPHLSAGVGAFFSSSAGHYHHH